VTTYGLISELVIGHSRAARTVGWALRALPEPRHDEVPWWRVINAQGRISNSNRELPAEEQRRRLEAEAVRFNREDRVDLERYGWWG
jgi:methylated-DNA-protein-cysteine methyltransferase-like protein